MHPIALAWDVSAIPEGGLTDIEVLWPSKGDHTHAPPPPVTVHNSELEEPPVVNQKITDEVHHHLPLPPKPAPVMITGRGSIHSELELGVRERSRLQQNPVFPFNLSTITEESGSYKSSSSGSRLTVSSASSRYVRMYVCIDTCRYSAELLHCRQPLVTFCEVSSILVVVFYNFLCSCLHGIMRSVLVKRDVLTSGVVMRALVCVAAGFISAFCSRGGQCLKPKS